ncbi:hypothetical protein niasHS_008192 [Heterodera schachtii]|uniref:Uncharacterized protein n=2 Tax=Heterodera schachtii TaxID=97005 RepID=A0ABD2J7Y1_HETSC
MICIRNSTVTFTFCQNNRPTAFSHTEFRAMATHGICTEYAPRRFPAIVLRIRGYNSGDPDGVATALLFRSGRVVMTGVRAPTCGLCSTVNVMAHRVRHRVRAALRGAGLSAAARALRIGEVRVRNLVSSVRLPFRVHIERLYNSLMSRHSAIDQNHDDDNVLADTQFVGVRSCRLDFCAFPALRCTLSMALSESQQQQPQSVAPPIAVTFLLFVNGQLIVTGVRSVEHIDAALQNIETMVNRSTYRR